MENSKNRVNETNSQNGKKETPWLMIFLIIIAILVVANILKSCASSVISSFNQKKSEASQTEEIVDDNNDVENVTDDMEMVDEQVESVNATKVSLVDKKIVESDKVSIEETAENSLGNVYSNSLVFSGYDSPYVKYNLAGQYERLIIDISCLEHNWIEGEEFDFRILADDEDEPLYRTKVCRAMSVSTIDVDVKGVDFITLIVGYNDGSSPYKGVIVSDAMLYKNYSEGDERINNKTESDEKSSGNEKLISFKFVEADKSSVEEDVENSLGDSFDKALVLSGYDSPYVKYYLNGQYESLVFNLSCLEHNWIESEDFDFRVTIDDEEEPAYKYTISRDMGVQTVEVDVSGANFITIRAGYGSSSSPYKGIIISDGMLYVKASDVDLNDFAIKRTYEDIKLTKLKKIEFDKVSVEEDAKDAYGNVYDRTIVMEGYDRPYVKYYLARQYNRFAFDVSCLDYSWIKDDTIKLTIYYDGDYENLANQIEISRAIDTQNIELDVSGVEFITIEAGTGSNSSPYKGVILSNGMLYK